MVNVIQGGDPTLANRVIANDRTAGWASHIIPRNANGEPEKNSTRKIGSRTMPFASAAARRFILTDYYDSGLIDIRRNPVGTSTGTPMSPGIVYHPYNIDVDLATITGPGTRQWQFNDRFKYFSKLFLLFANHGENGSGSSAMALFDPNDTSSLGEGVIALTPRIIGYSTGLYQRAELSSTGMLQIKLRGSDNATQPNPSDSNTYYYTMRTIYETRVFEMRQVIANEDTWLFHNINRANENRADRITYMRVIVF